MYYSETLLSEKMKIEKEGLVKLRLVYNSAE